MLYIGVTVLGFAEADVWHMVPYKLLRLMECHVEMKTGKSAKRRIEAGIDDILGGANVFDGN